MYIYLSPIMTTNIQLPSRWIQVFFDVDNNITTMKPTKIIDTSSPPYPTGVGESTIIFQDKQKQSTICNDHSSLIRSSSRNCKDLQVGKKWYDVRSTISPEEPFRDSSRYSSPAHFNLSPPSRNACIMSLLQTYHDNIDE